MGQTFVGRNELSLRAVGSPTGVRNAVIDQNVTMFVSMRSNQGTARLKGLLDMGAGVSVMSDAAWKKLGAPIFKPWTVPITMANDEPIKVLGITKELSMRLNELELPVAFIVFDYLGEEDFLLSRTLIREFDVLID